MIVRGFGLDLFRCEISTANQASECCTRFWQALGSVSQAGQLFANLLFQAIVTNKVAINLGADGKTGGRRNGFVTQRLYYFPQAGVFSTNLRNVAKVQVFEP